MSIKISFEKMTQICSLQYKFLYLLGFLVVYFRRKREEASKIEWSANVKVIEEGIGENL